MDKRTLRVQVPDNDTLPQRLCDTCQYQIPSTQLGIAGMRDKLSREYVVSGMPWLNQVEIIAILKEQE